MDTIPKTKYGLAICNNDDPLCVEIGIDEAGKGPMFGRVYAAAVILPKHNDETFSHEDFRDSKKFTSAKKLVRLQSILKKRQLLGRSVMKVSRR